MASRPTSDDAARRLVILRLVVVRAITAMPRPLMQRMFAKAPKEELEKFKRDEEQKRDRFIHFLRDRELWHLVSPKEREFLSNTSVTMTEQLQISASWRLEAAMVLGWALGLIPQLPPYDTGASSDFLKADVFPQDPSDFIASAQLRSEAEIDRRRSIAEMWHWRSRTRQLIESGDRFPTNEALKAQGIRSYDDVIRLCAQKAAANGDIPPPVAGDFPAMGKAYRNLTDQEWSKMRSITMERHFAFNWLCGYSPRGQWDETPTDT